MDEYEWVLPDDPRAMEPIEDRLIREMRERERSGMVRVRKRQSDGEGARPASPANPPRNASARNPKPKHTNVNARMLAALQKDTEAAGWTARQWAKRLHCAESSVKITDAWRMLANHRELAKAELRANRPNRD